MVRVELTKLRFLRAATLPICPRIQKTLREDYNPRFLVRSETVYALAYGEVVCLGVVETPSPESQSGMLTTTTQTPMPDQESNLDYWGQIPM